MTVSQFLVIVKDAVLSASPVSFVESGCKLIGWVPLGVILLVSLYQFVYSQVMHPSQLPSTEFGKPSICHLGTFLRAGFMSPLHDDAFFSRLRRLSAFTSKTIPDGGLRKIIPICCKVWYEADLVPIDLLVWCGSCVPNHIPSACKVSRQYLVEVNRLAIGI
jgi:hypothetical protein